MRISETKVAILPHNTLKSKKVYCFLKFSLLFTFDLVSSDDTDHISGIILWVFHHGIKINDVDIPFLVFNLGTLLLVLEGSFNDVVFPGLILLGLCSGGDDLTMIQKLSPVLKGKLYLSDLCFVAHNLIKWVPRKNKVRHLAWQNTPPLPLLSA